jgi:hypothetical protein
MTLPIVACERLVEIAGLRAERQGCVHGVSLSDAITATLQLLRAYEPGVSET